MKEMEVKPRKFGLESVLSIVTGVPLCPPEDVSDLINFMFRQTIHPTRLEEAKKLCRKRILNEYPSFINKEPHPIKLQVDQLKEIVLEDGKETMAAVFLHHWLAAMKNVYGEKITLYPLPYRMELVIAKA